MKQLIFGLIAIGAQGVMYFMMTVFGISEGMSDKQIALINFTMYAVIVSSVLAAVLLVMGYAFDWKYIYSFIFLPLIVFVPLFLYSFF